MNILLVKLSSLGDVLHNLPVVWDIRARYPDAHITWVVEEGYVDLLAPLRSQGDFRGIDDVVPFALRRWRKALFAQHNRQEMQAFRQRLQSRAYDLVIETQGLIKSALVTRLARRAPGGRVFGLANRTQYSGYEPLARWFYSDSVTVPWQCHAVERSRRVTAAALGLPWQGESAAPRFYPPTWLEHTLASSPPQPYVLCFHATARDAKRWADAHWVALGRYLADQGLTVRFPWGSAKERAISEALAAQVPGAEVPDAFSLHEAPRIVAQARLVIGVDTGLTHMAAVLGRPTVELYCDSPRWKTEGYWSPQIRNLGDMAAPPSEDEVMQAVQALLQR